MRAAIYNPYWDTLGGGERYTASFVALLLSKGFSVDIEWKDKKILKQVKSRFDIDITSAKVIDSINRGDGYDLCFWLSDGSIPTLKSRNNILHFQFPFKDTQQNVLFNRMKFFRIKHTVCNSNFTKKQIDKEYKISSEVIYPPVDTKLFKSKKKENLILYVGRFSQLTQSKNQHILINAFKKMYDGGFDDWKLVLAGGAEIGSDKYIEKLKSQSKSYPISIVKSPSLNKLKDLYGKAKIFWSAVGFQEDVDKKPMKVEHFGITLVEAMSAGCIPVVTDKGGYREILPDKYEFFFNTEDQLVTLTRRIVQMKKSDIISMSKMAEKSSQRFSIDSFNNRFSKII